MTEETLFAHIEKLQGATPWGRVLDAGTGSHSLSWVAALDTESWTAVTADEDRARGLASELGSRRRPGDRIVTGDWSDAAFLHGEVWDIVLADYLLGALDGFAPYFQDRLIERLRPHVGARLYFVGLEPYDERDRSESAALVREIARLRDACILLASHRTYREYPREWVLRHIERAGLQIEDATVFPIVYGAKFINGQLDVCARKLPHLRDRALAKALGRHIEDLRDRALSTSRALGGLRFGEDYVIAARPRA